MQRQAQEGAPREDCPRPGERHHGGPSPSAPECHHRERHRRGQGEGEGEGWGPPGRGALLHQDPASDSAAADGLHYERGGEEGAEGEALEGDAGRQGGGLFQYWKKEEEVILWFNFGCNKSNERFIDGAGFFLGKVGIEA